MRTKEEKRKAHNETSIRSYHKMSSDPEWRKKRNKKNRIRYRANADKIRPKRRKRKRELEHEAKMDVLNAYSKIVSHSNVPCCACCNEKIIEFLEIDHIGGIKNPRYPRKLRGGALYRRLRKYGYPTGFQVLCHNCNFAIGPDRTCPHKKKRKKS